MRRTNVQAGAKFIAAYARGQDIGLLKIIS